MEWNISSCSSAMPLIIPWSNFDNPCLLVECYAIFHQSSWTFSLGDCASLKKRAIVWQPCALFTKTSMMRTSLSHKKYFLLFVCGICLLLHNWVVCVLKKLRCWLPNRSATSEDFSSSATHQCSDFIWYPISKGMLSRCLVCTSLKNLLLF